MGMPARRASPVRPKPNGSTREQLAVASYRAPGAMRPAAPSRVRVARRGAHLRIGGQRVARARGYETRVRLSDGRRPVLLTGRAVVKPRRR